MRTVPATIFTALLLGLTWAVRGHFGHEWGAAWAGAIGAMAVLVAAGRVDWFRRLPALAALGAVGWGAGGMMSYGSGAGRGVRAGFPVRRRLRLGWLGGGERGFLA